MSLSLSQTCQRDRVSLNKHNFDEGDKDFKGHGMKEIKISKANLMKEIKISISR